jgi:hypothetical protein
MPKETNIWILRKVMMDNSPGLKLNYEKDIESFKTKYVDSEKITGK